MMGSGDVLLALGIGVGRDHGTRAATFDQGYVRGDVMLSYYSTWFRPLARMSVYFIENLTMDE